MSIPMTKEFNIEHLVCATTGKPFGSKYAGAFLIRRPSLLDKRTIAMRDAATISEFGTVNPELLSEGLKLLSYIVTFVEVTATATLPEWFDLSKMYDDDDEDAILAVWQEVQTFLMSFRSKADGDDGGKGNQQPSLLVPEQV
jgi:hypothetical protein